MNSYIMMWKKGLTFTGRTRRKDFWMASLISYLIVLVLSLVDNNQVTQMLINIYSLAFIVPQIAMIMRRLHDSNHSGAWFLVSFIPVVGWLILLVFLLLDSTSGENRFGSDPKAFDRKF